MRNRLHQLILIASVLPASWLGMMVVHELGHVIGAWLTGGTVGKVVLHPLAISRTDLAWNPHPLFVSAAGPIVGVLLPLAVLAVAQLARLRAVAPNAQSPALHCQPLEPSRGAKISVLMLFLSAFICVHLRFQTARYLLRFFAGFCLVANGVYIGVASFARVGDAADLLFYGAAPWHLWLFAAITIPLGFFLWHGQGRHFGLGESRGNVNPRAACISLAVLTAIVVLELLLCP
ncbi:MAG: hypothetical protein NTW87_26060 [Planctomycetota bacterium]|nr:hypothetical protein [Planctomycetota bacterium]